MVQTVNQNNFKEEVLNFQGVVLVDFTASWCGPCKMLSPLLEELSESNKDNSSIKIVQIDVDQNQDLAREFQVMSIPNVVVFKNGKNLDKLRMIGLRSKEAYSTAIFEALVSRE